MSFIEFGKALVAKTAVIVAVVEDVLGGRHEPGVGSEVGTGVESGVTTGVESGIGSPVREKSRMTAITHAGADLLLRTAYCPDKFSHRVALLNKSGEVVQSVEQMKEGMIEDGVECRPSGVVTVSGPLCFR